MCHRRNIITARLREAQAAGIKFTHRPKIRFFDPQRGLVAPIHVKLDMADDHEGSLGCVKFHLNRCRGRNSTPKYQKFAFWVKIRPRGQTP